MLIRGFIIFLFFLVSFSTFTQSVKIMPLGNSITQGEDLIQGDGINYYNTYRRILWHELVDSLGYDVDFVGSLNSNYPCGAYNNPDFDMDHEGHWSWTVDEILDGGSGGCSGNGRLGLWLQAAGIPDIALVHVGTNDCWIGQSVPSTISEIEDMIDTLRFYNPDITVLISQIIGHRDANVQLTIDQLNDSIPVIAANMTTPASQVIVVDQESGFLPFVDLYDAAHPTFSGEEKMAARFLEKLVPVLDSLASISGDLFQYLSDYIDQMPGSGSNVYSEPNASEMMAWRALLINILSEEWILATSQADALGYSFYAFQDTETNNLYYVLERKSTGPYWGTYVFNPSACRDNLLLMAPHARYDTNTGKEAAYCFLNTNSYGLMLSGTHRCNHNDYSSCSGTTSSCGSSGENYRISDLAHSTNSAWQETVEVIADSIANSYFIQLHGFSKQSTDPYLIMSNGTTVTPAFDPLSEMATFLKIIDTTLTFKIANIDLAWTRLRGFSNTNGRYINNSSNPCSQNASTSTGRFLHLEQEKTKLRDDATGWDKIARAIRATFTGNNCPSMDPVDNQNIWYVRPSMTGNAKTWAGANGDLASVLSLADAGDSIYITTGDYVPTNGLDRDASFQITSGISVFGGFPIGGGTFEQRDPVSFTVALNGDIGTPGVPSDDLYQVVKILSLDADCVLDGIEIGPGSGVDAASVLVNPVSGGYKVVMRNVRLKD